MPSSSLSSTRVGHTWNHFPAGGRRGLDAGQRQQAARPYQGRGVGPVGLVRFVRHGQERRDGWTWSVGETYVAELFPTRLRATGFGLGVSIGRIRAIAGPLVTGAMAAQIGIGDVARWFALIWVFLIVGYLIGPETRGRSLGELDAVTLRPHTIPPA